MQTTMASSICPLCKGSSRANATSNPLPTRLCDQCRSMLTTILPQAVAGSVVIVDAQKPTSQQQVAQPEIAMGETDRQPPVNESAFAFDAQSQAAEIIAEPTLQPNTQGDLTINSFDSSAEPVFFHAEETFEAQTSEAEETSQAFFIQAEEKAEAYFVQADEKVGDDKVGDDSLQVQEKIEDHFVQAKERSQPAFSEPEFRNPPQTNSSYLEQLEKEPEKQPQSGNFFVAPEANQLVVQENWHTREAAPLYAQEPAYQTGQPVSVDTAHLFDDKVDNYPVLMVQQEKRSMFKPLMVLAAIALIALGAAGYWFVYKPFFGSTTPNATQRAGATGEDNMQPAKPEKTAENRSPAPQQEASANASLPPTTKATPEDKPTTPDETNANLEGHNGQGKFSLQAASFPSEQAASEFSEKLIRSGIPAYLASANIAGKGRWFRVRVGRFATAGDAEKFAAQAKQRAKATGLNLELVVCDYGNS